MVEKMRGSVLFPAACIQVLQKCGSHTVFTCSGNFQINAQRKYSRVFPRFLAFEALNGFYQNDMALWNDIRWTADRRRKDQKHSRTRFAEMQIERRHNPYCVITHEIFFLPLQPFRLLQSIPHRRM